MSLERTVPSRKEKVAFVIAVGTLIAALPLIAAAIYFAFGSRLGDGTGIGSAQSGDLVAKIWLGVAVATYVSLALASPGKKRMLSAIAAAIYSAPLLLLVIHRLSE